MHPRLLISVCKLLHRHPFGKCSLSASSFTLKSITTFTNQLVSGPISSSKSQKNPIFLSLTSSNSLFQSRICQNLRQYSVDTCKEVDEINLKFAEAREEIEAALESRETVYFDEEAECARIAVREVLDMYKGLLAKLPESEKTATQRSMGLKIEQLKAELDQLND